MLCRILAAQIIHPVDYNFIARFAAFQQKSKVRVFGNTCTHVAGGDGFAIMGHGQHLDVMRGNEFVGGFVLVPAMFHWVRNQGADLGVAVQPFGAYFYA